MPEFPKELQVLPLLTDFKGKNKKKGYFQAASLNVLFVVPQTRSKEPLYSCSQEMYS